MGYKPNQNVFSSDIIQKVIRSFAEHITSSSFNKNLDEINELSRFAFLDFLVREGSMGFSQNMKPVFPGLEIEKYCDTENGMERYVMKIPATDGVKYYSAHGVEKIDEQLLVPISDSEKLSEPEIIQLNKEQVDVINNRNFKPSL